MSAVGHGELDWSVATRAFPGETESGDHYIVTRTSIGWLLAVADGLAQATDGINGDFVEALSARQRPDALAGYILDSYAKATDDALVLVARWRLLTLQQGGLSP